MRTAVRWFIVIEGILLLTAEGPLPVGQVALAVECYLVRVAVATLLSSPGQRGGVLENEKKLGRGHVIVLPNGKTMSFAFTMASIHYN